jgi:hypothetical protein
MGRGGNTKYDVDPELARASTVLPFGGSWGEEGVVELLRDKSCSRGLKCVAASTTLFKKLPPESVVLNKVVLESFSSNSHSSISLKVRMPSLDITIVQSFREVHSIHVIQNFRICSYKLLLEEGEEGLEGVSGEVTWMEGIEEES